MNITEKRFIPQDLIPFTKLLQYPHQRIMLLGSAGLASQRYYSDYDLLTIIPDKDCEKIYNTIKNIIEKSENNPDMYFIEIKIQTLDGNKIRKLKDTFCNKVQNIDFIKLDYVIRIQNKFVELSIIYKVLNHQGGESSFVESVKDDIKELCKEGEYYKVLKRCFSILTKQPKSPDRDKRLILLTNFFNSPVGQIYQDASNLKAIKLLLQHYRDTDTIRKVELNLKDLKLDLKDIPRLSRAYNKEALKILQGKE
jgi:hypothetical protein